VCSTNSDSTIRSRRVASLTALAPAVGPVDLAVEVAGVDGQDSLFPVGAALGLSKNHSATSKVNVWKTLVPMATITLTVFDSTSRRRISRPSGRRRQSGPRFPSPTVKSSNRIDDGLSG